jgi:hypothetical protein
MRFIRFIRAGDISHINTFFLRSTDGKRMVKTVKSKCVVLKGNIYQEANSCSLCKIYLFIYAFKSHLKSASRALYIFHIPVAEKFYGKKHLLLMPSSVWLI